MNMSLQQCGFGPMYVPHSSNIGCLFHILPLYCPSSVLSPWMFNSCPSCVLSQGRQTLIFNSCPSNVLSQDRWTLIQILGIHETFGCMKFFLYFVKIQRQVFLQFAKKNFGPTTSPIRFVTQTVPPTRRRKDRHYAKNVYQFHKV